MSKVDKETIIRAAEEVVRERGARKLTLDAVAAQCGLSKGGLLHHFRTKQALLQAMLESSIACEAELVEEYAAEGGSNGGPLASRICSAFCMMQDDEGLPRALIAAVAEDPALLEPIKAKEAKIRSELTENCSDPDFALLLLLATRGLFLGRVLGVLEPDDPIFERLRKRLLSLAADLD
ncbi:Tetracycline repressor protein class A [Microbulbifer aggregans]|uniref:Tetracycline repressor protein class A n=1 Tax=Microbulbifer aggregans TaxID=1769779 RepID=A0A1C9WAR4_9GAMM|nr:TetR/AcrR family transcriptional regulator [Microbulbifer aggregans]AOS98239.1 Tetracycline repressor protein class A [Microbulbifer aggregans]